MHNSIASKLLCIPTNSKEVEVNSSSSGASKWRDYSARECVSKEEQLPQRVSASK